MAPTVYRAREREATSIPIDQVLRDGEIDILPQVQGRDYFDIRFQGDKLRITAGKYVGLIPLNERVYIDVEPKMPVGNLMAILSAVGGELIEMPILEREYRAAPGTAPPVLDAMASAFVASLRRIEVTGLPKAYEPVMEAGANLKGQINFNESIQRFWSQGTRHRAVCSYFELTADLVGNRLLRYAVHLLLAQHRATGAAASSVSALAHFEELLTRAGIRLEQVDPRNIARDLHERESREYVRALRLARLIVSGDGIELPASGSDVSLPSFLVNMESLFEGYVRHIIWKRLPDLEVLDGNREGAKPLFDDRRIPPANPDVVVRRGEDECVVVFEAKYKVAENRDDVNQVLAYALSYRIPQIVLVLPAESEADRGLTVVGEVQGIRILRYRLNLAAANLDGEESAFIAAIEPLIAS